MATGFREEPDLDKGALDYICMVELKIWFQAQVCFPNLSLVYY